MAPDHNRRRSVVAVVCLKYSRIRNVSPIIFMSFAIWPFDCRSYLSHRNIRWDLFQMACLKWSPNSPHNKCFIQIWFIINRGTPFQTGIYHIEKKDLRLKSPFNCLGRRPNYSKKSQKRNRLWNFILKISALGTAFQSQIGPKSYNSTSTLRNTFNKVSWWVFFQ